MRALIVNRLHPHFDAQPVLTAPVTANKNVDGANRHGSVQAFATLNGNWADLRAVADREEIYVTALAAQVADALVDRIPLFDDDVHDLEGVQTMADHLFGLRD